VHPRLVHLVPEAGLPRNGAGKVDRLAGQE